MNPLRIHAFVASALLLACRSAQACSGSSVPFPDELDGMQVLQVEVTGVHLTEYEAYGRAVRSPSKGKDAFFPTSSPSAFTVRVLVDQALTGRSATVREFRMQGCRQYKPRLRDKGFVILSDKRASGVWSSEPERYAEYAKALGIAPPNCPAAAVVQDTFARSLAYLNPADTTDCGVVPHGADAPGALACARQHLAAGTPFRLALQTHRANVVHWNGIVTDGKGKATIFAHRNDEPGSCQIGDVDVRECASPVLPAAPGRTIECAVP